MAGAQEVTDPLACPPHMTPDQFAAFRAEARRKRADYEAARTRYRLAHPIIPITGEWTRDSLPEDLR